MTSPIAWGAFVSPFFRDTTRAIAFSLGMDPDDGANRLMACIAFETAESFSPAIRNGAGSGAVGLIQFMPKTALELGTTVDELALMTRDDQLHYVWKYFYGFRNRLRTLGDVYAAILWPQAIGKDENFVLWTRDTQPVPYRQNVALDYDKDGCITKGEVVRRVAAKLDKGKLNAYCA